VKGVIVC
jgi:hypothetical protein